MKKEVKLMKFYWWIISAVVFTVITGLSLSMWGEPRLCYQAPYTIYDSLSVAGFVLIIWVFGYMTGSTWRK